MTMTSQRGSETLLTDGASVDAFWRRDVGRQRRTAGRRIPDWRCLEHRHPSQDGRRGVRHQAGASATPRGGGVVRPARAIADRGPLRHRPERPRPRRGTGGDRDRSEPERLRDAKRTAGYRDVEGPADARRCLDRRGDDGGTAARTDPCPIGGARRTSAATLPTGRSSTSCGSIRTFATSQRGRRRSRPPSTTSRRSFSRPGRAWSMAISARRICSSRPTVISCSSTTRLPTGDIRRSTSGSS